MIKFLKWFSIVLGFLTLPLLFFYQPDMPLAELKKKYTNKESKFINIQGMSVHYRLEGKGPCLLLLHGTAASLHTFDGWVNILKQSFTMARLDLPAFGLTGPHPKGDYSEPSYVSVVADFMTRLSLNKCHVAGNSLGGRIAWYLAATRGQLVNKLILIDAAGYKNKTPFVLKLARLPVLSSIMTKITPRFLVESSLKEVYADDSKVSVALVDRYFHFTLRAGNRRALVGRAKTNYSFSSPLIKLVRAPTLIIWGKQDLWIPLEHSRLFARDITNAKVIEFNAGHVPMEEIPDETAKAVRTFLLQ